MAAPLNEVINEEMNTLAEDAAHIRTVVNPRPTIPQACGIEATLRGHTLLSNMLRGAHPTDPERRVRHIETLVTTDRARLVAGWALNLAGIILPEIVHAPFDGWSTERVLSRYNASMGLLSLPTAEFTDYPTDQEITQLIIARLTQLREMPADPEEEGLNLSAAGRLFRDPPQLLQTALPANAPFIRWNYNFALRPFCQAGVALDAARCRVLAIEQRQQIKHR